MGDLIAIVGGSGFIGSALAEYLGKRFDVRVLDSRDLTKAKDGLDFVKCDIRSYDALKKALEGADLVLHTAIVQIPQINDDKRLGYEVNVIGTQNVCEVVRESSSLKGLILVGTWHTIGEKRIVGVVDERFGFRPDMVEDRARLYALSKMAQESIVRLYDEDSTHKVYGIIRIGTALGEKMPEKTAARIFIDQALKGEVLTPYEHSMHRPMLYVDVQDVCRAFESYAVKILGGQITKTGNSLSEIVNVYYPEPMTIIELAEAVKQSVITHSNHRISPQVRIVKTGQRTLFTSEDKSMMRVDISRGREFLRLERVCSPAEAIDGIVERELREGEGRKAIAGE